jgi:hypothetical protein
MNVGGLKTGGRGCKSFLHKAQEKVVGDMVNKDP